MPWYSSWYLRSQPSIAPTSSRWRTRFRTGWHPSVTAGERSAAACAPCSLGEARSYPQSSHPSSSPTTLADVRSTASQTPPSALQGPRSASPPWRRASPHSPCTSSSTGFLSINLSQMEYGGRFAGNCARRRGWSDQSRCSACPGPPARSIRRQND